MSITASDNDSTQPWDTAARRAEEMEWARLQKKARRRFERALATLINCARDEAYYNKGNGGGDEGVWWEVNAAVKVGLGIPPATPRKRTIRAAVRTAVYERDGYACVDCGVRKNLTLDHVIPESRGGSDDPDNLQTMCRPCNLRKGTKIQ